MSNDKNNLITHHLKTNKMEKTFPYFGFNTASRTICYKDETLEGIKSSLRKDFPHWSESAIEHLLSVETLYQEPIRHHKSCSRKKTTRSIETTINRLKYAINGYELNNILRLAFSIYAYHKNAHRQWGTCVDEIFNDSITKAWNECDNSFFAVLDAASDHATKQELHYITLSLMDAIEGLKNEILKFPNIFRKAVMEMEYINGNERRLGLKTILDRVDEEILSAEHSLR